MQRRRFLVPKISGAENDWCQNVLVLKNPGAAVAWSPKISVEVYSVQIAVPNIRCQSFLVPKIPVPKFLGDQNSVPTFLGDQN